ncbi:uncharacterized protein Tco025E_05171 [Trypanosoma conorhini]|uniref:Uncharacterized protein n=1 Tax=Trypanosoma conorhini TaxID=83891 RepID=A0A3R7KZE7_9TRYP|nr:uncharacterized protein Tco025E_05171 [Trypanosoma conorhini]RNF16470.1 hypothetical protein Tco025E_05171 [Trypanosoma conorhini]
MNDETSEPLPDAGPAEERLSVYSVPPFSYYVAPKEGAPLEERSSPTSKVLQTRAITGLDGGAGERRPPAPSQRYPAKHLGRSLEQQRYLREINRPYIISLWDQACLGYLFPGMFEGNIDAMELFHILKMVLMVATNSVTVAINVFHGTTTSLNFLDWARTMSGVVFFSEFLVVYSLLVFLLVVIVQATLCGNVGAKLAGDIAALSNRISTFSAFRVVAIVSPAFAVNRILPIFQRAMSLADYLRAVIFLLLWLCACVLAMAAVMLKMTQISFTSTQSITNWSLGEFIQLIGLTMNLARLDDSYTTETQVLLDAVHHHFCSPGIPKDGLNRMECLYTRVCDYLSLPRPTNYAHFDVIFNYHFKYKQEPEEMTLRMKLRKMLNYLAFVLRMDNAVLRRFLQMSQSPIPFFQMGRDAFVQSFKEQDELGMLVAVWRSDPALVPLNMFARENKKGFDITYTCADGREVWDVGNLSHLQANSESEKKFHDDVVEACHSFF